MSDENNKKGALFFLFLIVFVILVIPLSKILVITIEFEPRYNSSKAIIEPAISNIILGYYYSPMASYLSINKDAELTRIIYATNKLYEKQATFIIEIRDANGVIKATYNGTVSEYTQSEVYRIKYNLLDLLNRKGNTLYVSMPDSGRSMQID